MAERVELQAGLAQRRRRGPRPLAVLACFAALLVVSWPVAAIAKSGHGHGKGHGRGDAPATEQQPQTGGDASAARGEHGDRSGDGGAREERGDGDDDGGAREERGDRGRHLGRIKHGEPAKGPKHGKRGKGPKRGKRRNREPGTTPGAGVPSPPSPAPVSAPVSVPAAGTAPAGVAPAAPTPTATPAPALAPGRAGPAPTLPRPTRRGAPDDAQAILPALTRQPPAGGPSLGAAGVIAAATVSHESESGGAARDRKGGSGAGKAGGDEIPGVTGVVKQGAREVVEVIPTYMWALTSSLMALALVFAAASWLLADRARQLVRQPASGPDPVAGIAPLPVPVSSPRPRQAPPAGTEPLLLDGVVSLDAGPFSDMDTLASFERDLASLSFVDDVRVGQFHGDRVLIDLALTGPTDLARELRQGFAPAVAVSSPGGRELVVDIAPPRSRL